MTAIPVALDQLVAALVTDMGTDVPVTRDPGKVRAHVAASGVCVFVRPPEVRGRTHGGLLLDVPLSVVLPATDSQRDNDRAYPTVEQLLIATGQDSTVRSPVYLGGDQFPAHTITVRIGADHEHH